MSLIQYRDLILDLFNNKYYSCNMIAIHLTNLGYYVSRQGIILALKSWGIDTSKHSAGWVSNTCPVCGHVFPIKRSEMRRVLSEGKTGRNCIRGEHVGGKRKVTKMENWDKTVEDMIDNNTKEDLKQKIKELYSIIWLVAYANPMHTVRIPSIAFKVLSENDCFTTWDDLASGDRIITAHRGE